MNQYEETMKKLEKATELINEVKSSIMKDSQTMYSADSTGGGNRGTLILITDIKNNDKWEFNSISQASRALKISASSIRDASRFNRNLYGRLKCVRKTNKIVGGKKYIVTYPDGKQKVFNAGWEAAKYLGIRYNSFLKYLKDGYFELDNGLIIEGSSSGVTLS